MERTCGQCALKALKGGMCPIFNADMSEELGCPYFTTELHTCEVCGNYIIGKSVLEEDDNGTWRMMCQQCQANAPCNRCRNQAPCAFLHDRSCTEPTHTMVQQRQGNMVMQTQILNPKRIAATCAKGCPCFWEEGLDDGMHCLKQQNCGGCINYKTNWRN